MTVVPERASAALPSRHAAGGDASAEAHPGTEPKGGWGNWVVQAAETEVSEIMSGKYIDRIGGRLSHRGPP